MSIVKIYNTGDKTKSQIHSEFVVRKTILNRIMDDIRNSKMKFPEQDYLIIGERGMGKTMLLSKIKYEIIDDSKLSRKLTPILFPEELNGVNDLFDLWKITIENLIDQKPENLHYLKEIEAIDWLASSAEEEIFKILIRMLKSENTNLLLLIDNIDSLLKKIGEEESRRLREILITNSKIRIIGASSTAVDLKFSYDKAFYEHFITIKLKGLSYNDTIMLLKNLGQIFNTEERIKEVVQKEKYRIVALRSLTGGNLRNIVMLFNILLSDSNSDPIEDLFNILEDVTPLNIHKINDLEKKQRKIVDFLAMEWDAAWVSEIAKEVRMKSNEVSSQLKSLEANNIVSAIQSNGRKKLYMLKDRFFNIWYLMRYSRKEDRNRVKWLVNFYEIWCSQSDLKIKGDNLIEKIQQEKCSPYTLYLDTIAMLQMKSVSQDQKIEIFNKALKYLEISEPTYAKELEKINKIVKEESPTKADKQIESIVNISSKKYINKGLFFEKVKNDFKQAEKNYKKALETNNAEAHHRLGHLYLKMKTNKWREHFIKSINNGSEQALYCFTSKLARLKEYKAASEILEENWQRYEYEKSAEYLGQIYEYELKQYDKAEILYNQLYNKYKSSYALHRLAHVYEHQGKPHGEIVKQFKKAISEGEDFCKSCLAFNYYNNDKSKEEALSLIEEIYTENSKMTVSHTYACILLWHNRVSESISVADKFLRNKKFLKEQPKEIFRYLIALMKKGNYNLVDSYFQDKELNFKQVFKPLYYALMHYLNEKYPNELKRMGSEISDTVLDLINEITPPNKA